jgi:hypothetical protein
MYVIEQASDIWTNSTHEYNVAFKGFKMHVTTKVKSDSSSRTVIYPFMFFGSSSVSYTNGTSTTLEYDLSTDTVRFTDYKADLVTNIIVTLRKSDLI